MGCAELIAVLWGVRTPVPRLSRFRASAFVLALAAVSFCALAQPVPPPSTDPARLRERFDPKPSPESQLQLPELKGVAREVLPDAVKSIRVTLKRIQIEGATVLPTAQLQAQAKHYIGREITGSDIFGLAHELTVLYRNAGYFLSLVIVPPQSLGEGTLTLRVIEGYIANVHIEGDPRVSARLTAIGEKIKASRPLEARVLERYLLIANDFPGLQLRSVLAPSQTVGAADLTLIATLKEFEGFASLDNYGSKYLGPGQATVGFTGNQVFGVNDQLRFIGVGSGNSQMAYGQLSYSQVLNVEGLKLGVTVSQARTQPGDILDPFDVKGRSDAATVSLSYPFLRTRNQSVLGRVVYDHSDINTDTLGSRVTEDKIRAVRTGLTWLVLDQLDGHNSLDVDVSKGIGGTGPGDLLKSRVGADGSFSKLSFDYERFQPLGANYGVTVGIAGQWTDEPLLSSEQFALGGRRFGRAYEAAELVGDRGLAFRLEPRYVGQSNRAWLRSYQVFGFYDIGEVWKLGNLAAGTPESQSLASAGVGVRLFLGRNVTMLLEAAQPLTKSLANSPGSDRDARLLGSVLIRF